MMDLDPAFYKSYSGAGRVLALMGRLDEAIAMLKKARSIAPDVAHIIGALGHSWALAGCRAEAAGCLDDLRAAASARYVPSTCFALIHMGLGESDKCLEWLERASDQHEMPLAVIGIHPVYDSLRSEPRFQAVLKRAGFLK